jgi:hypothetical protein
MSTLSVALGLHTVPEGSLQKDPVINHNSEHTANLLAKVTTRNLVADADYTLVAADWQTGTLIFTDTGVVLTGGKDIEFPDDFAPILVDNQTAQTLTLLKDGGTGVAVAAGERRRVYSGAADVVAESGAGGGGAVDSVNGETGVVTAVTKGKHAIPIMASGMAPSVTGGCAPLASIASAANQPDIVTLNFDPGTEEYAQFAIPMPKSWNEGTVTAQFRWSHAATTTNFAVIWGIQSVAVSDDDTIAVNFGTAQEVTDTGGTTNDLYASAETSAITVAGTPATADTVYFRVYRKAADGGDTLEVDARLHSVVLFLTTDADNDA